MTKQRNGLPWNAGLLERAVVKANEQQAELLKEYENMKTKPTLSPEVEKEFDDLFTADGFITKGRMWDKEKATIFDIKQFLAEKIEEAREEGRLEAWKEYNEAEKLRPNFN